MTAEHPHIDQEPVLTYEVVVSRLSREGVKIRYEADERERQTLAEFLDALSVEELTADVTVTPWRRDGVSVRGDLRCRLTQASVVTLEPVHQDIREPVDLTFLPEGSKLNRLRRSDEGELLLDPDGDDIPETFTGDRIDLGAAFVELIALAMDPYPRGEGEQAPEPEMDEDDGRVSPFAALSRLRRDNDS